MLSDYPADRGYDNYIHFRRFSVAVFVLATGGLLAAAVATLFLDEPKFVTLAFGVTAGFGLGSLVGLWFVHKAINGLIHYAKTGQTAR